MMLKAKAKAFGAFLFTLILVVFTTKAYRAGKKVERAKNLEAHIKGGQDQRQAEENLDEQMEEKVDEIRNTDDTSDRLTKQPRV